MGRDDLPGVIHAYLGNVEHVLDGAGEREVTAVSPPSLRLLLLFVLLSLWFESVCKSSDDLIGDITQGIGVPVVRNCIRMLRAA